MARIHTALLIIGLIVVDGAAGMDSLQMGKVERFKQRIDFEGALRDENTAEAVRAIWPNPMSAPGLGAGWSVVGDTTWRTDGGAAREWVLRRSEEAVSILIFVADGGVQPARQVFLLRATESNMVDVPYVKGPAGLGTLAVHLPFKQASSLIWVYRNTAFHVGADDTSLDILPMAKWLQATAESGLVSATAAQFRAPGPLNVSTRRAAVGQPIEISVAAPPAAQANCRMELEFDRQAVEVVSQRGLAAQVRGMTPGRTALEVYVIEHSTLLSVRSRIDLEFTTPGR